MLLFSVVEEDRGEKMKKNKKSLFHNKGNSENFDYLGNQIILTIFASLFLVLMFISVRFGWIG